MAWECGRGSSTLAFTLQEVIGFESNGRTHQGQDKRGKHNLSKDEVFPNTSLSLNTDSGFIPWSIKRPLTVVPKRPLGPHLSLGSPWIVCVALALSSLWPE